MHEGRIRLIAAISAASLVAQPLIVVPGALACPMSAVEARPSASVSPANMVPVSPLPFSVFSDSAPPVTLIPVTSLSAAAIETQRTAIAQIMVELGEDDDRARQMATELTADDLAVLLANPKMMQKAGDLEVILVALAIAGVIIALVLLADSSTVVITT